MTFRWCFVLGACVTLAGCGGPQGRKSSAAAPAKANTAILESRFLKEKPEGSVLSVAQAKEANDDQEVIVEGKVPPATTRPFLENRAGFTLMSAEDLEDPKIKEELACDDAATWPSCQKLLGDKAIRVELVDQSGSTLKTTLQGFQNIGPGSTLGVKGKVKKDGKNVRVLATAFYVAS